MCFRMRELKAAKVGSLLHISGHVVRTHPVHPELVSGTFVCMDCRTVIKEVEQQFKYTQVPAILLGRSVDDSMWHSVWHSMWQTVAQWRIGVATAVQVYDWLRY